VQGAIALPFALEGGSGALALAACALGYPLARALRRVFPAT